MVSRFDRLRSRRRTASTDSRGTSNPTTRQAPSRSDNGSIAAPTSLAEPWRSILQATLDDVESADEMYRPTNFWQPGVVALMSDLEERGIESFKSWPSAGFFFYPRYSPAFSYAMVDQVMPVLRDAAPNAPRHWFHNHLVGATEANRDVDVALALIDAERLPLDIVRHGESPIGQPPQRYSPFGSDGATFGKPYLNYLIIMSALSRHIEHPIRSVIEIGAGFGVLGEILLQNDPGIQYVDLDIPPLSTIAHFYLSTVFGDAFGSHLDVSRSGSLSIERGGGSACLSSWQLPLVSGEADLFVNAFSFQEMEPPVVENYAREISRLGAHYVVSLNSRRGKPLASDSTIGVRERVTSDLINSVFNDLGYRTIARLGRPCAPPQAELLILRRRP